MPRSDHADGPERTETETETGFGLATFNEAPNVQTHGENRSRLGDLNPGPTHYECGGMIP
jgi:hypothetical protein